MIRQADSRQIVDIFRFVTRRPVLNSVHERLQAAAAVFRCKTSELMLPCRSGRALVSVLRMWNLVLVKVRSPSQQPGRVTHHAQPALAPRVTTAQDEGAHPDDPTIRR